MVEQVELLSRQVYELIGYMPSYVVMLGGLDGMLVVLVAVVVIVAWVG